MRIQEFPQRLVIELVSECNLTCSMCPRHYVAGLDGFMKKPLWTKLIDEIVETSPSTILLPFWRGESLLHPAFAELMGYALDKRLKIHISTNGQKLAEDHIATLLRCDFVTFSIHTPAAFREALRFLFRRTGSPPTVQVSFVKGEKTEEKFLESVVTSPDLMGFDCVRLYEEHTVDGVFGHTGRMLGIPRIFCPLLEETMAIACDGKASRCNHVWETEKVVDLNVLTVKEAWRSGRFEEIRRTYPDAICGPCDQWTGHTMGESWQKSGGTIEHFVYGKDTGSKG